jgi:transposase
MAGKDIIMASQRELKRLHIVQKVLEGTLKQTEAAEMLSLSIRQTGRVVIRVKEEGLEGVVHRSRGRESNRKIPQEIKEQVLELYRQNYEGFGPTLAQEKLQEREGISISDETLRMWLLGAGLWKKRRKGKQHRQWRPRKDRKGWMAPTTTGSRAEGLHVCSWDIAMMPPVRSMGDSTSMREQFLPWTVSDGISGRMEFR